MNIELKNNFTDHLPADSNLENSRRQVLESVYSFVTPIHTSNPSLIHVSEEMSDELGFTTEDLQSKQFLDFVTGNHILEGSKPFAMCYAGHQFGNWAGQLGD
ncbi:MAG: YdiU family protein, partial [Flavobacteriaceae bacterium]|nr:YdiU family protein [Flavobacteriaceae bacterium]